MEENLEWEPIKTEHIVRDKWIDFRRVRYRMPDGTEFGPFYNYSRSSYVVILASDTEGNYLCVRQYRHGIGQVTNEVPAGAIERSSAAKSDSAAWADTAKEDTLAAAKRELQEETGYISDEWKHLITIPSNATMADNYAYIFIAKNCRRVSSLNLDDTEFLNVRKYTAQEIEDLIAGGQFQQAIHVMAWYMAKSGK